MNKLIWLVLPIAIGASLSLASCKKDDVDDEVTPSSESCTSDPTSSVVPSTNYHPLSIGSYWIYEWVQIDTLGNETPMNQIDTVTVIGDTVINGNTYAELYGTWLSPQPRYWYKRDSAGYLITNFGGAIFTTTSTSDTLGFSDFQIGISWKMMAPNTGPIFTPAGTFPEVLSVRSDFYHQDPNYPWGIPRTTFGYFAENVGLVQESHYYVSTPDLIVQRLTEYYIAP